jgi:hypothetical protein
LGSSPFQLFVLCPASHCVGGRPVLSINALVKDCWVPYPSATAHVARQYLGSVGKIDNSIVAVSTFWANEQRYYPLHVAPYTPEGRLAGGKQDPAFHSKPQIALALVDQALAAGITFKAIVTDCFYGDHHGLVAALRQRRLPFVLSHRGTIGRGWALAEVAHSFDEAVHELRLPEWHKVTRRFRDGHSEQWLSSGGQPS